MAFAESMKDIIISFLVGAVVAIAACWAVYEYGIREKSDLEEFQDFVNELSEDDIREASEKFKDMVQEGLYVQLAAAKSRSGLALDILEKKGEDEEIVNLCAWTLAWALKVTEQAANNEDLNYMLEDEIDRDRNLIFSAMKNDPELTELVEYHLGEQVSLGNPGKPGS